MRVLTLHCLPVAASPIRLKVTGTVLTCYQWLWLILHPGRVQTIHPCYPLLSLNAKQLTTPSLRGSSVATAQQNPVCLLSWLNNGGTTSGQLYLCTHLSPSFSSVQAENRPMKKNTRIQTNTITFPNIIYFIVACKAVCLFYEFYVLKRFVYSLGCSYIVECTSCGALNKCKVKNVMDRQGCEKIGGLSIALCIVPICGCCESRLLYPRSTLSL